MRKLTYIIMSLAFLVAFTARAKGDVSEMNHVRVTMNDGSVVEGYITTFWSETGLFKSLNRAFKMESVPGAGDERRYTADEVRSVEFVVRTSADSGRDGVISADVANPSTFHPHKVTRQFVHIEDSTEEGTIYWWNAIDRQQMQLGTMTISTVYGVKLRGDDVIIPFVTGNVVSLNAMRAVYRKKDRKLVDYIDKRILSGGSKMWNLIPQRPVIFLDIVREYSRK